VNDDESGLFPGLDNRQGHDRLSAPCRRTEGPEIAGEHCIDGLSLEVLERSGELEIDLWQGPALILDLVRAASPLEDTDKLPGEAPGQNN